MVKEVRDGVAIVGQVFLIGGADRDGDVFQLDKEQRQAVDKADDIGAAAVEIAPHPHLADGEKVVVFGDDTPDLGMFTTFGCSVAMGNAKVALKDVATHVTRSNDEDGVAFALKEYLSIL